ncbi:hypothetical protein DSCO28_00850 [Desulfosarcina ovata subsp. sediminis]|uniref:Uncharacterized protein n=1 Tax=Desulfosarcina ovata subsp. sediminis TaxID=885957 RepID=A0A5K7ZID8_9BACT|nr:hypothetical protein DSCO28_00850 [Desulfosarcina ovata subsp. sediminis]
MIVRKPAIVIMECVNTIYRLILINWTQYIDKNRPKLQLLFANSLTENKKGLRESVFPEPFLFCWFRGRDFNPPYIV